MLSPLLVVLAEGLGEVNLGRVMEAFTGQNQYIVIHDAIRATTTVLPTPIDIAQVRALMAQHGWRADE